MWKIPDDPYQFEHVQWNLHNYIHDGIIRYCP